MVLLAKRVRESTVASISTSVSSASLHLMMRWAMCSSSVAVKRAPLGWVGDWGAEGIRGCFVADFFLAFAIFQSWISRIRYEKQHQNQLLRLPGPTKRDRPLQEPRQQQKTGETPALLRKGDSDFYVSKTRGRCAVACAHGLHGLAFAAIGRAPERPVIPRAYPLAAVPEFGGDAAVAGIFDHAAELAAFDLPADFRGKLKMIAAIVNGPGAIGFHEDRVVGIGDQVVVFPGAGIDADVSHPNHRQTVPTFGAHGAAGACLTDS